MQPSSRWLLLTLLCGLHINGKSLEINHNNGYYLYIFVVCMFIGMAVKDKKAGSKENPCRHGGVYKTDVEPHRCICTPRFSGKLCQLDVDECITSPCPQGKNCYNTYGGFRCEGPGYFSKRNVCPQWLWRFGEDCNNVMMLLVSLSGIFVFCISAAVIQMSRMSRAREEHAIRRRQKQKLERMLRRVYFISS